MSSEVFLIFATNVSAGLLILAGALTLVRLVRGPSLADRVLALDLLTLIGAGLAGLLSQRSGTSAELDIALALCLVSFVSTVAFARYIWSRKSASAPPDAATEVTGD